MNAVPLEDERVLVAEIQFVTRLREEIRIDAAVEFLRFLPRQQANLIEPLETSLLAAKLDARSQPVQFVFRIRPVGPGDQRLLVIVLRVFITADDLEEMTEFYQDFRVPRLQTERLEVARFGLGKAARLLVHVTALEKEKDIDVRRDRAQGPVVKFGGDQILLAVPGLVRKAQKFAL